MVVLIFDMLGGLCNQFYDITNGINFCLLHKIPFTFRHCSFRNDNLITWTDQPVDKLFDMRLFRNYELYVEYDTIKDKLTDDNCYDFKGNRACVRSFSKTNILDQILELNKEYVVLRQFWSLYAFRDYVDTSIHTRIRPSANLMEKYIEIKDTLIKDEPYNFIHYRYEKDFTSHFKVTPEGLDKVIERTTFKNNDLKIYVATTNIKGLIDLSDSKYDNLLYKNDDALADLNFEERAFIDYMVGINSEQCYGNKKSAFSIMINQVKGTGNYYA